MCVCVYVCVCVCVIVCVCEKEKGSLCVCMCVFVGVKNREGEKIVWHLSTSSKHRTAGHTLMLGMDSQTIVCLIFLCLLCTFLKVGRQGRFTTEYH